jgi:hypothetical protein
VQIPGYPAPFGPTDLRKDLLGPEDAQVRVAHLSPDAPNVDVYVNGEPALTDVPYTTVSSYLSRPDGTQQITVYAAGDTSSPVIDAPVKLAAGGAYTIAPVGLVTDGSITAQVYRDDLRGPLRGKGQGTRHPRLAGRGPRRRGAQGWRPSGHGPGLPGGHPHAEVPAGTYTLDVNAAGTDQTIPDAALASGGVYSAFAVGTVYADSLDVLLVQDNASTGATASASASANASASAPAESLPHRG